MSCQSDVEFAFLKSTLPEEPVFRKLAQVAIGKYPIREVRKIRSGPYRPFWNVTIAAEEEAQEVIVNGGFYMTMLMQKFPGIEHVAYSESGGM